jgi:hypothetical protein
MGTSHLPPCRCAMHEFNILLCFAVLGKTGELSTLRIQYASRVLRTTQTQNWTSNAIPSNAVLQFSIIR